jgi:hypothetical protein
MKMSNFNEDGTERVMWEADWERLKARERVEAQIKAKKDAEDAIRQKEHNKKQQVIKNQQLYSDEIAQEICERISAGELLINICDDDHMPTIRRCNQWLKQNDDFLQLYKDSINDRLSIFEEQVILIADDASRDFKEVHKNGKSIKQYDPEVIARAKLRVDVRFRHLKAGRPQKWGDSTTLITKSDDEEKLDTLTLDELDKKIADLERNNKAVRSI